MKTTASGSISLTLALLLTLISFTQPFQYIETGLIYTLHGPSMLIGVTLIAAVLS